jgi:ATP-binding cassette subfamily B protein
MRILLRYTRRYWPYLLIGLAFLALTDTAQILVPDRIRTAIDSIRAALPSDDPDVFGRTALILVGLVLVTAIFRAAWRLVMMPVSFRVAYEIRRDLMAHLRGVDSSYFLHHPPGDLMSRATSDIDSLRRFLGWGIVIFFDVVFVIPLALYLMLRTDWQIGLLVAAPVLFGPALSTLIARSISTTYRKSQDALGLLSARAQEDIAGVRVLKSHAREDAAAARYRAHNVTVRDLLVRVSRIYGLIGPYFHVIPKVGVLLLLIVGSGWALKGRCSLGQLVAFQWYAGLLSWPTFGLGWGVTMLQRARASGARLEEVFAAPLRERPAATHGPDDVRGELAFTGLRFAYDGVEVFDEVDLTVNAGEVLGLTGPTGCGKSTLLAMAVSLVEPPPGTVLLDGYDVRQIAPEKLRRHVALVQQNPYLFSRTIRQNISFARPDAADGETLAAVRVSGLAPDLRQFEDGLDALVGDRGITLSGGQRLRVALARALVARPQVLLLDDVFSAVDARTEELIWQALREEMRGRTMVVASHRVSALRRCDRIAVIEDGRVVDAGTNAELLSREGFYSATFALQELFER